MAIFFVEIIEPDRLTGDVVPDRVSGDILSTVIVVLVEELVFPAGSVILTLIVLDHSGREVVGVNVYVPSPATVPVPRVFPDPSVIVNVDPGSPIPLIVGVESLVRRPLVGLAIIGVAGAVVSTVTEIFCGVLVFPVESVAVTERVFTHSGSAVDGVNVQLPDPSAVTVPSVFPDPSCISTVEFASAVPVIVGVVVFVRYGVVISPATFEMTGAEGTRESIVNVVTVEVLVFPAGSVVVTL